MLGNHTPLAGLCLRCYCLLKEIRRGGLGSVKLADRDNDFYRKQKVIKVVKRGMDSTEVLARFRHQRQILAGLEHPFSARLIDGGILRTASPYLYWNTCRGSPLTRTAVSRASAWSSVYGCLQVCEAVALAEALPQDCNSHPNYKNLRRPAKSVLVFRLYK